MIFARGLAGPLEKTAKVLCLVFIALFFLTPGSVAAGQYYLKLAFGFLLLILAFLLVQTDRSLYQTKSLAFIFFLCFVGFLLLRFLLALLVVLAKETPPAELPMVSRYLSAPLGWSFALGLLALGFVFSRSRQDVYRLLWVVSGAGFFLALNALPRLLMKGATRYVVGGYRGAGGEYSFFFPVFYFQPWVEEFFLSRRMHSNFAGDVIAFGFFASLAGFLFVLERALRKKERRTKAISLGLFAVFAGITAAAVLALFSRGTILSFALALLIFVAGILLKYPGNVRFLIVGLALGLVFFFMVWAANIPGVLTEIFTTAPRELRLESEWGSFAQIREGWRRALGMYRDYPLLGVGTGGYITLSRVYTTLKVQGTELVQFTAMSHYLRVLAEEGVGALFYFLFLVAYAVEVIRRLIRVQSRLQFFAGFALFISVFMVLFHASIHHLMEGFSVSSLVYLFMGASLGILSRGFDHGV